MSQTEAPKPQLLNKLQLSAEAESFVPGKLQSNQTVVGAGQANIKSSQRDVSPGHNGSSSQQPLNQYPRYVTSCYPFVQGDPGSNTRAAGPWQGAGHSPNAGNYGGQRMPAPPPPPASYPFGGTRPHGPPNFAGSRHMRPPPQGYVPRGQPFGPPPPVGPAPVQPPYMGQGPPVSPQGPGYPSPVQHGYPPYYGYPPPLGGWGPYPPDFAGQYGPGYYGHCAESGEWSGSERARSVERKLKKKEKNSNMVSIGIQNESGVLSAPSSSKKKGRTKTIILMDAAIQTDFSDDIANLTLAEKPNSLYEKNRPWWEPYNDQSCITSTDSEEVDSDSGYSSPLHRRNQANNGTHPANHLKYVSSAYISTDSVGIMHKPTGNSYPPYMPSQGVGPRSTYPYPNPTNTYAVAPYLQGYPPLPGKVAPSSGSLETIAATTPVAKSFANVVNMVKQPQTSQPQSGGSATCKTEPEDEDTSSAGKKKKRRSRRRKRKSQSCGEDAGALSDEPLEVRRSHSGSRTSVEPLVVDTMQLHFDDENEFPDLLSATSSFRGSNSGRVNNVMSYSDILKSRVSPLSQESVSSVEPDRGRFLSPSPSSLGKETKNARKRRKRREMADIAAENELAEITLEQQVLKELSSKHQTKASDPPPPPPPSQPNRKKSKQPISLNFAAMIDALEKRQEQQQAASTEKQPQSIVLGSMAIVHKKEKSPTSVANVLDANAPVKRGKEREVPKPKKPSPLKKVILKEREEKKRLRLLDDTDPMSPDAATTNGDAESAGVDDEGKDEDDKDSDDDTDTDDDDNDEEDDDDDDDDENDAKTSTSASNSRQLPVPSASIDSDLSQDAGSSSKTSSMDCGGTCTPMSADMSPISQASPISMSPLSPGGSPLSSGVNSPIAGNNLLGNERRPGVVMKIHSRRFREYCTQILDKEIDNCCTVLLQDLVRFQDKLFHKDPTKAKIRRRIVLGLREVTKHLKLKKIRCVIISPNLERIQSKGGLDDALNNIIELCTQQEVPFVFALGRRALGRACAKLVPVSVVGIFNYEGTEDSFHRLMELTEQAKQAYEEMVAILEKEAQDYPLRPPGNAFPHVFAHMGHSRTPSACSAISFTSSILSEPISENYPHSEPETDSRGYEIIREVKPAVVAPSKVDVVVPNKSNPVVEKTERTEPEAEGGSQSDAGSESPNSCNNGGGGRGGKITAIDEIDEGHEADTEDINDNIHMTRSPSTTNSTCTYPADEKLDDEDESTDGEQDNDTVRELPHIDSIHSSVVDLSAEILSQHSSKTLDLNTEVLSTHSSRLLGEGGGGDQSPPDKGRLIDSSDNKDNSVANCPTRIRDIDKERIESWVAESQQQLEQLSLDTASATEYRSAESKPTETAGIVINRKENPSPTNLNSDNVECS